MRSVTAGLSGAIQLRDLLKDPHLIDVPHKYFSRIHMCAWIEYYVSPQEEGLQTLLWWWSRDLTQQFIFHIIKTVSY